MRAQKNTKITNLILDNTEFGAKVLHLTKRVYFIMLNDSVHNEEVSPDKNYKNNLIYKYL